MRRLLIGLLAIGVACAPLTPTPPASPAPTVGAASSAPPPTLTPTAAPPATATAVPGTPTATTAPAAPTTAASPAASPTAAAKPAATSAQPACGETIRASITLSADLKCPGDALIVGASGITIDLGGKKITGPGTGSPTWPRPNLQSVGIKVGEHQAVTVKNGFIEAFSSGILLDNASSSVIEGIDSRESYYGIYLNASSNNVVRGSKFITNVYGITLYESHNNRIHDNESNRSRHLSPGGYGLYVYGSRDNLFQSNTFDSNVNWGLWLSSSQRNAFYRNNIVNNRPQTSDDSGGNIWHDAVTKEGNYWSDWEGTELTGTGIGNHPYLIWGPGSASDPFPFVRRNGWLEPNRQRPTAGPAASTPTRTASNLGPWLAAGDELVLASPDGGSVAARAPIGSRASNVAWSPDGATIYVVDAAPSLAGLRRIGLLSIADQPMLVALDAKSGARKRGDALATIAQGAPHVVADRDGQHVHVLDGHSIATFDAKAVGWKPPLGYPASVVSAFASWKHQLLLVANKATKGVDVVWIGGRRISYTIPVAGEPVALAANRAGTRLYTAVATQDHVPVIETEQYAVVDRLRPSASGRPYVSVATSPDGKLVYALDTAGQLTAHDLGANRPLWQRQLQADAATVAASPDGARLYVASGAALLTLATADGATTARLPLTSPVASLLASP